MAADDLNITPTPDPIVTGAAIDPLATGAGPVIDPDIIPDPSATGNGPVINPDIVPEPEVLDISPDDNRLRDAFTGMTSTTSSDPPPFDIDGHFNALLGGGPIESIGDTKTQVAGALKSFARPFLAQGYGSAAALNRGMAAFSVHLDSVAQFLENRGLGQKGGIFEAAAGQYEQNAEYWQERAEKVGINFIDEIVSEGVGGAVPGITTFALDVASGYTFPATAAAADAEEAGENPITAGLLAAAKTGTLHHLFRMMAPFNNYIKAPTMGTVFGIEEAQAAPEGEKLKAFVKGAAIGVGYAVTSPGGRLGLNEVAEGIRSQLPKRGEPLLVEKGELIKPISEKPRPVADLSDPVNFDRELKQAGTKEQEQAAYDRRNEDLRDKFVKDMTPVEKDKALLLNELTHIPNRRRYNEDMISDPHSVQISVDLDGLKWANDTGGHQLGDKVLGTMANRATEISKQVGDVRNYHFSGDEFPMTAKNDKSAIKAVYALQKSLEKSTVEWTDTNGYQIEMPITFGFGTNSKGNFKDADLNLIQAKEAAKARGEKSDRGEPPLGIRVRDNKGNNLSYEKSVAYFERERLRREELARSGEVLRDPIAEAVQELHDRSGAPPEGGGRSPAEGVPPAVPTPPPATPVERQRKFLKTASEAADIEPALAEKIKSIDPQNYTIQPNKEVAAAANVRVDKEGVGAAVEHVLSDAPVNAEKGAMFVNLMERFQRTGDLDRAVEMTEAYDRQLREAGRFVQAASMWNRLTPQAFIRWGNRQRDAVRKRYGVLDTIAGRKPKSFELTDSEQKEIIDLHRKVNELPDGPEKSDLTMQMIDVVAREMPPSVSELFDAYRYQNMLSSPRTQLRNITENIFNTFITRPADIVSIGAVDLVKSGLTGTEREDYVSNAFIYQKAAVNAVPNASRIFAETWRSGKFTSLEKPDIGIEAKNVFEQARAEKIPKSLTIVSRFMEAADKFNMALISAGEIARLTKQGVPAEQAYSAAQEVAESYLYRGRLTPGDPKLSYPSRALSGLGDLMLKARETPGLRTAAKWYIPFVRTPINKAIAMIEYSPLGLIKDPRVLADKEVAAKAVTGAVVTAIGASMALNNETTWAPPAGADDKALWYSTGRKPYSIKLGDKWVPVWYLGPFAMGFALPMAAKYYNEQRPESMTDDSIDKLLALTEGTARFIGSQSSTQSLGALFSALSGDIDYTFKSQTGFTVQQIIPGSAMIRWTNTLIDPVYRHPKGFIQQIEANVPYLSQQLDARMTPFFEESVRDPLNSFLPYDIGKSDPMYESLFPLLGEVAGRKGYLGGKLEGVIKNVRDKRLTPEEGIEEHLKLIGATPKVFEPILEE